MDYSPLEDLSRPLRTNLNEKYESSMAFLFKFHLKHTLYELLLSVFASLYIFFLSQIIRSFPNFYHFEEIVV